MVAAYCMNRRAPPKKRTMDAQVRFFVVLFCKDCGNVIVQYAYAQ